MGVLVFGDKEFVDQFLSDGFPLPVTGTAHDQLTAMQALKESATRDVVVGFPGNEGVDFTFQMVELHRDKRFYLAPTVRPTSGLWAKAAERGVKLISRQGAPHAVARLIQGQGPARMPAPAEVMAGAEEKYRQDVLESARVLRHRRVTVFSGMGGVSKSTVASAIACTAAAWAARKKMDYKVVVVGATRNRNQSIFEALRVPDTVSQSITNWESINGVPGWDTMERQLVRPDPQRLPGLYFLPPPVLAPDGIPAGLVTKTLSMLDLYFDLVVVDVDPSLENNATLVAVRTSPVVLLLVRGTASDVRVARSQLLPLIPRLQINLKALRLLVTRVHPGDEKEFSPANVAQALGGSIAPFPLVIPEDPVVHANANNPAQPPVVLAAPDCPFSRVIRRLTADIVGAELEMEEKARRRFNPLYFIFKGRGR